MNMEKNEAFRRGLFIVHPKLLESSFALSVAASTRMIWGANLFEDLLVMFVVGENLLIAGRLSDKRRNGALTLQNHDIEVVRACRNFHFIMGVVALVWLAV
jgi:hypothetical protein